MTKDTGGPAKDETLLDKRAGEAMQQLLREKLRHVWSFKYNSIAKNAYNQAEEMVKEKRRREANHED